MPDAVLAVFLLEIPVVVDGELREMFEMVADLIYLVFDTPDLLIDCLGIELGYLPDRFLHEFQDVVHDDFLLEHVLILLHGTEYLIQLLLPCPGVAFEYLVDPVFEEYLFEGAVVPVSLQFIEANLQFLPEQVLGVLRVEPEDVIHAEELRLVIHDDAGVRRYGHFAVGECIQGIYRLVRRNIVREVDHDVGFAGGKVGYLLDLDLSLVLCLEYGLDKPVRRLPVRDFGDGESAFVYLLYLRPDTDDSASLPPVVFGAVGEPSGREVRVEFEITAFEDVYRCIDQLVEIVRENLGRESHGYAIRPLGQQQRKFHRQVYRLLVPPVVGCHPYCRLRVEHDLLGEFRQPCLDVSWSCVGVSGQDVAPVTLTVDEQVFLPEGDERSEYGCISVRVELHRLSDDVGHLGQTPVIYPVHGMQDAALHGFETVDDVRHGPVEDDIRGIVEEPVLEHAGQLEPYAVLVQKPVVFSR